MLPHLRMVIHLQQDEKYANIIDAITQSELELRRLEDMKKKQEILYKHNHKIWESNGRWYTYVDNASYSNGMRRICATSREKLENKIYQNAIDTRQSHRIGEVYLEWMTERMKFNEIKIQSKTRMDNQFRRYFTPDKPICKMGMDMITEGDITLFLKDCIVKHNMTMKGYADLRTIIRGMFRFGKDRGYTSLNIVTYFQNIYLPKGMFRKTVKDKGSEVFYDDEVVILTDYLKKSDMMTDLGLLLQFQTGLRIGELSALKPEDVGEHAIHVQRTEIHYSGKNGHDVKEVQDMTKTESGNRYVMLTEEAQKTVKKIFECNPSRKRYLFERPNGTRIANSCFNRRLTVVCKKLGISKRSTHKIRKTYATNLLKSAVDEALVAEQMGHSDISTTRKYYYFCNDTDEEKIAKISKAITY